MHGLSAFDRQTAIVDYLRSREWASTRALTRFGVSEVTIRTDLAALERDGWLTASMAAPNSRAPAG